MGYWCKVCHEHIPCSCGKTIEDGYREYLESYENEKRIEEDMQRKQEEHEKKLKEAALWVNQSQGCQNCNGTGCRLCQKDFIDEAQVQEEVPLLDTYVYDEYPERQPQDISLPDENDITVITDTAQVARTTQAQKKAILIVGVGAMGLFAVIFIVAMIVKRSRKAKEKARNAIIVETAFIPISDKTASGYDEEKGAFVMECEKGIVVSDDKRAVDEGSIPVVLHTFMSEKEFKS